MNEEQQAAAVEAILSGKKICLECGGTPCALGTWPVAYMLNGYPVYGKAQSFCDPQCLRAYNKRGLDEWHCPIQFTRASRIRQWVKTTIRSTFGRLSFLGRARRLLEAISASSKAA